MKLNINIDMYKDFVEFEDLRIKVESFKSKNGIKNVMPVFLEEQPITWYIFYPKIKEILRDIENPNILDVGCGCGIWSLLVKKKFPNTKVYAIDKNIKAIEYTNHNAQNNSLRLETFNNYYSIDLFNASKFDLIILAPPYHIYPKELEDTIPLFARGGSDGQQEFKNQLTIANYHLKHKGSIIYNMMCLGDSIEPNYLKYIPAIFENEVIVNYTNIFPRIESKVFLDKLYVNNYDSFKTMISNKFPYLYYTSGIIMKENNLEIREFEHNFQVERDWNDRIQLHREINLF